MAQFFGRLNGTRGEATRLGSVSSGLVVEACSWQGKIVVRLSHNPETGNDEFTVDMEPHEGEGDRVALAHGVVGDINQVTVLLPQVQA